jgi:ribose transport system ATP-binding protein
MTVQENLFMTSYKKIANQLGILTKSRIRFAKNLLDESLNHQLSSADALGQQLPLVEKQKIVYQRYLLKKPKLLLCVKPTVTVDEASKHMVVDEIRRLSREGTAVVVIASDHDELHGLCHRMIHIT